MVRAALITTVFLLMILVGTVVFRNRTASSVAVSPIKPEINQVTIPSVTAATPTETTPAAAPASPSFNQPTDHRIAITADGFSPANVTIQRGDTVTFVNNDTAPHWPASNPHPAHTGCSGFDADHGLAQNESYRFNYRYDRSCSYHDHLHPRLRGQLELAQ